MIEIPVGKNAVAKIDDAARAYNAKAGELFGEFARINQFP